MEKVRKSCGLLNGIEVEAEGTRGGLCLAWKDDIDVTLRSFSKWHLDVMVKDEGNHEEWRFTGLYGSPYLRDQNVVWNLLKRLSKEGNFPWLVAGDFNEILYSFEKKGGLPRDHKRMEVFRETLGACNLMDIGFFGAWYTWEKGNLPETNIRERLDRGWQIIDGGTCSLLVGLSKWANTIKGKKGELRKRLTSELEMLMKKDSDDETLSKIIHTKIHLNLEIDKDEVYWEQRARVNWLKYGDRNTGFFHNYATARRRANFISKLILDNGQEINEESVIQEEAKVYFENLFTSSGVANPREILKGVEESISIEVNERLLVPFSEDEVRKALKGMGPTKAPGPDGFPAVFFQKYWHIVGKEVLGYCLGVLNEGREANSANTTNIVLIPKVHKPTSLVNFRPISLCTVVYKIIAKTIANRMQDVMAICIDQVQSAFVPVKLDMSKAYDRVKWDFIRAVMNKMGFDRKWIELIMTEGLSALMRTATKEGLIRGAKESRKGPEISHLLFADDCLMFSEATAKGARILKDLLKVYEECSGQRFNYDKSLIFYSTNMNDESKEAVLRLLGVRSSTSPEKYLGLPNLVGRRKKEAFRIWWIELLRELIIGVPDYCP
ncbi:reverse transcriptase [Gossypium australe]|uniref:Reverse transcriptase n=1 Tax=Gossypium australe TaxID=47621 RepID=A0A5B6VSM9_9ROSI|nr:reverse transcriptase [Gossypium australe]